MVRLARVRHDISCGSAREPSRTQRTRFASVRRGPMSEKRLELIRGLGPAAAMAMVVGHIIGTGVFLVPSSMARATGSAGLVFLVWVVGGALSLFGALTIAELGEIGRAHV